MYEGQPIICMNIIEENWVEYLKFVKQQAIKEEEHSKKVQEALQDVERPNYGNKLAEQPAFNSVSGPGYRRYYDISINGFWNWYLEAKIEA